MAGVMGGYWLLRNHSRILSRVKRCMTTHLARGKEENIFERNRNVSENVYCRFWLRPELSRVKV